MRLYGQILNLLDLGVSHIDLKKIGQILGVEADIVRDIDKARLEIAGKKVFSVADGYLIACFDSDVTEDTVKEIAKWHPFYAVFRDSGMATDSVATNFEQIFETYSPKTQRKVL